MKIGINARFLTRPYTGIGMYTRFLFEEMARLHPADEFIMVTNDAIDLKMPGNARLIVEREKLPGTAGMKKAYWEQRQVPSVLLREKVDIAHFPYPSNPWHGFKKPTVVTVHDTIPWTLAPYRRSVSTRLYQDRCRNAVRKADCVLAVSEAGKKDIAEVCGVPLGKITVGYNALPDYFSAKQDPNRCRQVMARYGVNPDKPYILYIGGYDERKNVKRLISVFESEIAPHLDIDLVLAGGKQYDAPLYDSYEAAGRIGPNIPDTNKGKIIRTGFVEDRDLPALYQSSSGFISLSSMEGFNIPLLEATVSGTPLIASDIPVHHEVVGDFAVYCPPNDSAAIAAAIMKLFTDAEFRQAQKQKLADFKCPFSWKKTADTVWQVYYGLIHRQG